MIAFRKTLGQKLDEISARIAPEIKALAKLSPDDLKMALGAHESQQSEADKERRRLQAESDERYRLSQIDAGEQAKAIHERRREAGIQRGQHPAYEYGHCEEQIAYWTAHYEARDMNERAEEYLDYREDYEDHQL